MPANAPVLTMTRRHGARLSRASRRLSTLGAAVLLAASLGAAAAADAPAITRDAVLARAQVRQDAPVPYSQSRYYNGYRTDCSGYVSYCWSTGTSWNTRTFYNVTKKIPVSSLQPGDALLKPGYHIRLFYAWLDDAHTQYVAYESANGIIAGTRIHSIADDLAFGYYPARYVRISYSPPSRNILKNPTFNVWARDWSGAPEEPVWWEAQSPTWDPVVKHRKDTYRTARNSLSLMNSSEDTATYSELSQSVPIVTGGCYRLTAYAKTAFDPAGVEMRLSYLDAYGTPVAETTTTGDVAALNGTAFRGMSIQATAPPTAVRARVAIRLAGGGTTDASGTLTPGTLVTLDDISLARPQLTVGIKSSRATAYTGTKVALSGTVTPVASVGSTATVYVLKPGATTWAKVSASAVTTSGSVGAWTGSYTFARTMPRGVYRFRTSVPAIPGYLGATSLITNVTLK